MAQQARESNHLTNPNSYDREVTYKRWKIHRNIVLLKPTKEESQLWKRMAKTKLQLVVHRTRQKGSPEDLEAQHLACPHQRIPHVAQILGERDGHVSLHPSSCQLPASAHAFSGRCRSHSCWSFPKASKFVSIKALGLPEQNFKKGGRKEGLLEVPSIDDKIRGREIWALKLLYNLSTVHL